MSHPSRGYGANWVCAAPEQVYEDDNSYYEINLFTCGGDNTLYSGGGVIRYPSPAMTCDGFPWTACCAKGESYHTCCMNDYSDCCYSPDGNHPGEGCC